MVFPSTLLYTSCFRVGNKSDLHLLNLATKVFQKIFGGKVRLKSKIVLNVGIVVTVALIITATVLTNLSSSKVSKTVSEQIEQRLIAQRDAKKEQIQGYLATIQGQVNTLADSLMTRSALKEFNTAFFDYLAQANLPSESQITNSLANFYRSEFLAKYQQENTQKELTAESLMAKLDKRSTALQYAFISNNPSPLGSKDQLVHLSGDTSYSRVHSKYHPTFSRYLNQFGYYDIFLVNAQGDIIYSVFKELDFATSLTNGPYANSGLSEVFDKAHGAPENTVVMTDFKPYTPSYESSAAFFASPIYQQNQFIGALIFQAPVDRINNIMTYNGKWQQQGLGNSGETYLVGDDELMRSQSRFLLEDKANYLAALKRAGEPQAVIQQIDAKDSSLGLASVKTEAVTQALNGKTGFSIIKDYRGVRVASAYSFLEVGPYRWAILSEIDEAEAFAAEHELKDSLISTSIIITLSIVTLGLASAMWLGSYLSAPIIVLNNSINEVAATLDFTKRITARVDREDGDEIGQVSRSFNQMLDKIHTTLQGVVSSSHILNTQVSDLRNQFSSVETQTAEQTDMTIQLSAAVEQMSATSDSVAEAANLSSDSSQEAVTQAEAGGNNVAKNNEITTQLSQTIQDSSSSVTSVAEQAHNIAKVLDVIKNIAEQTNLLALNAAIEAARAGDQGRGFAVVADEVRTLALRTQESTLEIQDIIESLQKGSEGSVEVMEKASNMVSQTIEIASYVADSFKTINQQVMNIESQNAQVATATTEQSAVGKEMAEQVAAIRTLADKNTETVSMASHCCNELEVEYNKLNELVSQFQL